MVEPPVFREYRKHSWLERHGQAGAASAVGQEVIPVGSGQDLGKNHRKVVAAQEIPLPAAAGKEWEFRLVAPAPVPLQVLEEEGEESHVFKAGDEVLDLGVVQEKLWKKREKASKCSSFPR